MSVLKVEDEGEGWEKEDVGGGERKRKKKRTWIIKVNESSG